LYRIPFEGIGTKQSNTSSSALIQRSQTMNFSEMWKGSWALRKKFEACALFLPFAS
jgi:hypothetical protein